MNSRSVKSVTLVAIVALLAMMVAPALADTTLYANNELNLYYWQQINSGSGDPVYHGTVGIVGNDEFLSGAKFYISNSTAAMTGTLGARLFKANVTGSPSYKPITSADVIETATNTFDLSALTGAMWISFNFSSTTNLTSSEHWTVQLYQDTAPNAHYHFGESATGGQAYSDTGVAWVTHTYGSISYVYTTATEGGGEPPATPDVLSPPTTWDETIERFTAFVVPLFVVLLPALLLMFLTRRADKWLLIIGLAIGVGLGYYFGLVPLWLVFLITIGIIGMAYQSVRGGGGN